MASMSLPTTSEVLEAAERLPGGATLVIPQVSWDDYEVLLVELSERRHVRITYDCGTLEIMSPLTDHEVYARFIDCLVIATCDHVGLEVESFGGATWKRRVLRKGAEGDSCYYIGDAERVIGKLKIDLETDPPPDVIVEIDTTRNSLKKLSIYAALLVPEVWRYDGKRVQINELSGDRYVMISSSRFLPLFTGTLLGEFIELMKKEGSTKARHDFLRRLSADR